MRISDWSSDVCSSDLPTQERDIMKTHVSMLACARAAHRGRLYRLLLAILIAPAAVILAPAAASGISDDVVKIGILNDQSGLYADLAGPGSVEAAKMAIEELRSEEHKAELQSLKRNSYDVYSLKKKKTNKKQ